MTSRRDFLKKAGLISAAFAVPALNVNGNTTQSKIRLKNTKIAVDDRWDVIVIGEDLLDVLLRFLRPGRELKLC